MIAEAGILGKIGLNSHGVGCTLNAITAHGVSYNKLPCHLALRTILESTSRSAAIQMLEAEGVASSCHLLVADVTGGTGLECSCEDIVRLEMDPEGLVMHTNHYILPHNEKVVESKNLLPDTWYRLRRIGELVDAVKEEGPSIEVVERLFLDEVEGDGSSICRHYQDVDELATLFRIVMDLGERRATVSVGLPVDPVENFELRP
jgi:isopenicillin-N N-acyltransferase-like protein